MDVESNGLIIFCHFTVSPSELKDAPLSGRSTSDFTDVVSSMIDSCHCKPRLKIVAVNYRHVLVMVSVIQKLYHLVKLRPVLKTSAKQM